MAFDSLSSVATGIERVGRDDERVKRYTTPRNIATQISLAFIRCFPLAGVFCPASGRLGAFSIVPLRGNSMKQTTKKRATVPSGPVTAQVKSPIATMIHIDQPNTFQFACSCGGKVFHIFRLPVERKRKIKTAHRLRIVGRCVDCQKHLRLAFGGINAR
jgi:hypothetical protein